MYDLYYCCTANMHQGWPRFALGPVHVASSDGALVISGFAPSTTALDDFDATDDAAAAPAGRRSVVIDGDYPWRDNVTVTIDAGAAGWSDVRVRVPCYDGLSDARATARLADGTPLGAPNASLIGAACGFWSLGALAPGVGNATLSLRFDWNVTLKVQLYYLASCLRNGAKEASTTTKPAGCDSPDRTCAASEPEETRRPRDFCGGAAAPHLVRSFVRLFVRSFVFWST